jgi:hypothetical protein
MELVQATTSCTLRPAYALMKCTQDYSDFQLVARNRRVLAWLLNPFSSFVDGKVPYV